MVPGDAMAEPVILVYFLTIRCAGGPRQQSELLRSDRGWDGRGHRLLGQFPSDLELSAPPSCCTESLPTNLLLTTPPNVSQLVCWAGPEGVYTLSAKLL